MAMIIDGAQRSRNFYIPRIKAAVAPEHVPEGEMFWLVNKCNAKFNHLRRKFVVVRESFKLSKGGSIDLEGEETPRGYQYLTLKIENERSGSSYQVAFLVKPRQAPKP